MSDTNTIHLINNTNQMDEASSTTILESLDSSRLRANPDQDPTNKRKADAKSNTASPKSPDHKMQKASGNSQGETDVVKNLLHSFNTTLSNTFVNQSGRPMNENMFTSNNNNNKEPRREENREEREVREEEEAYTVTDDLDFDAISGAIEDACPIEEKGNQKRVWIIQFLLTDINATIVDLINEMTFEGKYQYDSDKSSEEMLYKDNISHAHILDEFPRAKKIARIAFTSVEAAKKAKVHQGKSVIPGSIALFQSYFLRTAIRMPEGWRHPTTIINNRAVPIDLKPELVKFLKCHNNLILKVAPSKTPEIVLVYFLPSNEGMKLFIAFHSEKLCKGKLWGASFHTINWMATSNLPSLNKIVIIRPPATNSADIRSRVETNLNKTTESQYRRATTRKNLPIRAAVIGKRTSGRQPDYTVLLFSKEDVGPKMKTITEQGGILWNTNPIRVVLEKDYEKEKAERKAGSANYNENNTDATNSTN